MHVQKRHCRANKIASLLQQALRQRAKFRKIRYVILVIMAITKPDYQWESIEHFQINIRKRSKYGVTWGSMEEGVVNPHPPPLLRQCKYLMNSNLTTLKIDQVCRPARPLRLLCAYRLYVLPALLRTKLRHRIWLLKLENWTWKEILNSDVYDATIDVAQIDARSGKRIVNMISQSKIRNFLTLVSEMNFWLPRHAKMNLMHFSRNS